MLHRKEDALRFAAALAVAVLLFLPAIARANPESYVIIGDNLPQAGYPAVAVDDHGRPHVVWQDTGTYKMKSAWVETDSGHVVGTWTLNPNTGGSAAIPTPRLVSSGSRLFAGWIDCCTTALVARSVDGGATFTNPIQAPGDAPADIDIAADTAGVLYVVWREALFLGGGAIAFSTLPSNASTFTPRRILQASNAESPAVAVVGGRVYVAWSGVNGTVMVNRSDDGGQSFLPAMAIDVAGSWFQARPRLAASTTRAYAVWTSMGAGTTIRFASSRADGNFSAPVSIGTASGSVIPEPTLAVGGDGDVYAAWVDVDLAAGSHSGLVRLRRADPNGSSWQDSVTLSESNTNFYDVGIAVDARGHHFLVHDRLLTGASGAIFQVRLATDIAFPWELDPRVAGSLAVVGAGVAVLGVSAWVLLRPRKKPGGGTVGPAVRKR